MYLGQRGRRQRGLLEREKRVGHGSPEAFLYHLPDRIVGHRRHFVLELSELEDKRVRDQVRTQTHELAELDEGGPQILKNVADPLPSAHLHADPVDLFQEHFPRQIKAFHHVVRSRSGKE